MTNTTERKILIDPRAGFCGGVKRAIRLVEKSLGEERGIFVRGELIHNQREMQRLEELGLKISPEVESISGGSMFVRTHGETPEIYCRAEDKGLNVIDATCGNVRKSQRVIKEAANKGRKIYIFGKKRHPEVIGLCGYCQGNGVVVESVEEILTLQVENVPSLLIPQTTAHPDKFDKAVAALQAKIDDLQVYDAICPFVSKREEELKEFAAAVEAIIFVGGKHSSNTAVLFAVCQKVNPNAYFVDSPGELPLDDLRKFTTIGISGSASTPMWQLKEIAKFLEKQLN